MDRLSNKRHKHIRRKLRIRKKLTGTATRPRLSVYKSHRNVSIQAIDDSTGSTLTSVSTLEKEFSGVGKSVEGARIVGKKVGERLKAEKIEMVIFDRNGYNYHGIVKAIAEGAREAGLVF
ncbi:LSU ribosomal protein L18p (L5e) [Olavius algarvensis spirochete endosymbiont]|uniref:50S ribosomal protein L18 n=1 Tax=Olavius algarvensis spirochete endosymbiont TaxID=260710 RepID=UPI000F190FB2|nr:50S ribosomal protein L18 [Olavius algarvensis spirochete endosymbiont]VDB01106.1 LSU ribosomal protein L18p (L5e) [Olavius algarvensis spirochete endosymbiont]